MIYPNDPRVWVNMKYKIAWRSMPLIWRTSPKLEEKFASGLMKNEIDN